MDSNNLFSLPLFTRHFFERLNFHAMYELFKTFLTGRATYTVLFRLNRRFIAGDDEHDGEIIQCIFSNN